MAGECSNATGRNKQRGHGLIDLFLFLADTANNYQDEQSEQWIGDWMKERNNRDLMVIAT